MKNLTHSLFNIVLVIFTILGSYVYANDLELLIYEESRLRSSHSIDSVEINPAVLHLEKDTEVMLTLPNRMGEYVVVFDRYEVHQSGNTTWIGHVKGNEEFLIIVTYGDGVAIGMLQTPKGEFRLEKQQLLDMRKFKPLPIDELQPKKLPQSSIIFPDNQQNIRRRRTRDRKVDSDEIAYVDLMILYNQGMVEKYGKSETLAILDNLVTITNQAYIDSQVKVRHRLVKTMQVEYPSENTNRQAVQDLKFFVGELQEVRESVGADILLLVKPQTVGDEHCGVADTLYVIFQGEANAVVSYGISDDGGVCSYYAMAHEIGHLFGIQHDTANVDINRYGNGEPIFPYGYGYGKTGIFGTIMSYIYPRVGNLPFVAYVKYRMCFAIMKATK